MGQRVGWSVGEYMWEKRVGMGKGEQSGIFCSNHLGEVFNVLPPNGT